jgi:hypothetical protein
MSRIEVRRLRYRGSAQQAGQAEFAIGDALNTEVADDGRLILVRRFALGRLTLRGRGVAAAAAAAWRDTLGAARHGGSSDAASANCVWFRDAAEARGLLLRELAAGRAPHGWFWALAVPGWRQLALHPYLKLVAAEALASGRDEPVVELVRDTMQAGCIDALAVAPLPDRIRQPGPLSSAALAGLPFLAETAVVPAGPSSGPQSPHAPPAVGAAVIEAAPPSLLRLFRQLARLPELRAALEALARGLVLRAHPALALSPRVLAAVVRSALEQLEGPGRDPLQSGSRTAPAPAGLSAGGGSGPAATGSGTATPDGPGRIDRPRPPAEKPQPGPDAAETLIPPLALPLSDTEVVSSAAGLFLAIVPLIRIGWREWLIAHPELLAHQPGLHLLRHIAERHRVAEHDAVWQLLVTPDGLSAGPLAQTLELWRRGLDGWLRRKPRVLLADLAHRRGWLGAGPETTTIRFPLNAIDLRLRRLALDADPGWVDWLGHSVRFVYRDRPLLGPESA